MCYWDSAICFFLPNRYLKQPSHSPPKQQNTDSIILIFGHFKMDVSHHPNSPYLFFFFIVLNIIKSVSFLMHVKQSLFKMHLAFKIYYRKILSLLNFHQYVVEKEIQQYVFYVGTIKSKFFNLWGTNHCLLALMTSFLDVIFEKKVKDLLTIFIYCIIEPSGN